MMIVDIPKYVLKNNLTPEESYIHGYDDGCKAMKRKYEEEQAKKFTIPTFRFLKED